MLSKNNHGFSFVELMIVVAMLGGVSLVVMNINKQSTKSSTKYQFDSETAQIINEMNVILSSPSKCQSALANKNALSDLTLTNINGQYYVSTDGSAPSAGYGNGGVKIDSYSISSTVAEIANNTSWLSVAFQNKKILGGQSTITKKIKLNVVVDGSNIISTCNAAASSGSGTSQWVTNGSDIYYNTGNVGVGTASPAQKLEINGGIALNTASAKPSCSASTRGTIWVGHGAANVSDTVEVCVKDASDAYGWMAVGGGGGITSCPAGMKMVGDSGKHATYCIDNLPRSAALYSSALSTCYNLNDATIGRASVCNFSQWSTACAKNLVTGMSIPAHYEWISETSNGILIGAYSGDCISGNGISTSASLSYRCCLH